MWLIYRLVDVAFVVGFMQIDLGPSAPNQPGAGAIFLVALGAAEAVNALLRWLVALFDPPRKPHVMVPRVTYSAPRVPPPLRPEQALLELEQTLQRLVGPPRVLRLSGPSHPAPPASPPETER